MTACMSAMQAAGRAAGGSELPLHPRERVSAAVPPQRTRMGKGLPLHFVFLIFCAAYLPGWKPPPRPPKPLSPPGIPPIWPNPPLI